MSGWFGAVERWGATGDEISDSWPCDQWVLDADQILFRAITINAPPPAVFRWLCQLRVAPYTQAGTCSHPATCS